MLSSISPGAGPVKQIHPDAEEGPKRMAPLTDRRRDAFDDPARWACRQGNPGRRDDSGSQVCYNWTS
jgi:hypothetical protein